MYAMKMSGKSLALSAYLSTAVRAAGGLMGGRMGLTWMPFSIVSRSNRF